MTKEEVYDEQINPLMAQIIDICKEHKIPVVATFCVVPPNENGEDDTHVSTILVADDFEPSPQQLECWKIIYPPRPFMCAITVTTRPQS